MTIRPRNSHFDPQNGLKCNISSITAQKLRQSDVNQLEQLDSCFEDSSNISTKEKSTLYYISGYVCRKEILQNRISANNRPARVRIYSICFEREAFPPTPFCGSKSGFLGRIVILLLIFLQKYIENVFQTRSTVIWFNIYYVL